MYDKTIKKLLQIIWKEHISEKKNVDLFNLYIYSVINLCQLRAYLTVWSFKGNKNLHIVYELQSWWLLKEDIARRHQV